MRTIYKENLVCNYDPTHNYEARCMGNSVLRVAQMNGINVQRIVQCYMKPTPNVLSYIGIPTEKFAITTNLYYMKTRIFSTFQSLIQSELMNN